ncbi:MAG: hypothetical protein ACRCSN_11390 [Dermatophilaceae bacterium]
MSTEERIELAIVESGVRRDLGQADAALLALQLPELEQAPSADRYRLHYAYGETLLSLGMALEARDWFVRAMEGDVEGRTDAVERVEDIDGIVLVADIDSDVDEDGGAGGLEFTPRSGARFETPP